MSHNLSPLLVSQLITHFSDCDVASCVIRPMYAQATEGKHQSLPGKLSIRHETETDCISKS